jgi:hypothetical protein
MNFLISTWPRRIAWTLLALVLSFVFSIWATWRIDIASTEHFTRGQAMMRIFGFPLVLAVTVLGSLTSCASSQSARMEAAQAKTSATAIEPAKPFMAQVVGVQWLNPLQRRDYPTEWQLLWTLGLVRPNKNDDMVRKEPELFSRLQPIGTIASSNKGTESFDGFHEKYVQKLTYLLHDIYFSSSDYFYNVHTRNKKRWRELAGIRIEYALPAGRLDPVEAHDFVVKEIAGTFSIGNPYMPTLWSRSDPPDVRVTMGGANAGFTSLSAALDYLQANPKQTVWVMNWDAPSFPKDAQINENLVLLVLAGPALDTERAPLAWVGRPTSHPITDFEARKGQPPRIVQAWNATLQAAAANAGKTEADIGYVIHDAGKTTASSDRIGPLAQTLTTELPEFDFLRQTFDTPGLLGEMGAGAALTNVALGIAYANHVGKTVLVAGTTDAAHPTAVVVAPPAVVRPIEPDQDWFRARGGNHAYLPWWGIRHDVPARLREQGFSN